MIYVKVIDAQYGDEVIINLEKVQMIHIGACQLHYENGGRVVIKKESMDELVKFIERGEY